MPRITGRTLQEWKQHHQQQPDSAVETLSRLLAGLSTDDPAWIYLATAEQLETQIASLLPRYRENPDALPLFGVPFAIKDNIDVAGWPTSAACPAFTYLAERDATVVAKLKAAGAIAIGKTNLDQFATGLVGTRSPFGAVPNTFNADYIKRRLQFRVCLGSGARVGGVLVRYGYGRIGACSCRV